MIKAGGLHSSSDNCDIHGTKSSSNISSRNNHIKTRVSDSNNKSRGIRNSMANGTITTAATSSCGDGHSVTSRSVSESVVSKEEMFEMLREADPDGLSDSGSASGRVIKPSKNMASLDPSFSFDDGGDLWEKPGGVMTTPPSKGASSHHHSSSSKERNMVNKVQKKIVGRTASDRSGSLCQGVMGTPESVATTTASSTTSTSSSSKPRKKKILVRADGSVCSATVGSVAASIDPKLLEAMKLSGKTKISSKDLEAMGIKAPAQRGREKGSSHHRTSNGTTESERSTHERRSRSKSRPRSREGEEPTAERSSHSRARSKSRPRSTNNGDDDEDDKRARSSHHEPERTSHSRARSKSRPRTREGEPLDLSTTEDRQSHHHRTTTTSSSTHSRARSKSRPRARETDDDHRHHAVEVVEREKASTHSRARSKSRPRATRGEDDDDDDNQRVTESRERARSKSRPRAGRDPEPTSSSTHTRSRSRARVPEDVNGSIPRSKSRGRSTHERRIPVGHDDDDDDDEDRKPPVPLVIRIEPEGMEGRLASSDVASRRHEEHESKSKHTRGRDARESSPSRRGRSKSRPPPPPEPEDSEDESLPPVPDQIICKPDEMEPSPELEPLPVITGNSDEMYLKIKEAGITVEQFRALAQAGLTISEG